MPNKSTYMVFVYLLARENKYPPLWLPKEVLKE